VDCGLRYIVTLVKYEFVNYFVAEKSAMYCDGPVRVSVCSLAYLQNTMLNFVKFFVHVVCGRGSSQL